MTTDLKARSFSVSSSLQIAADQFEAELESDGLAVYRAASPADRVGLTTGYLNQAGDNFTIGTLQKGMIDEYVLSQKKGELTLRIRGRDQASLLLETKYEMRFLHFPVKEVVSQDSTLEDTSDPFYVPKMVGVFEASFIAGLAAAAAGKKLRWSAPDYTLQNDFVASGRAIDTIYALARPLQVCEPFRADVMIQGDTVVVQERTPDMVAESINTFSIADGRIQNLEIRQKRAIKYGRIRLRGANEVDTSSGFGKLTLSDGGETWGGGSETKTNTTDTKDDAGNTIGRVVEEVTYRMPDQIVTDVKKTVYAGDNVVSRELTHNDWEPSSYGPGGPTNKPNLTKTVTSWEGWLPGGGGIPGWGEVKRDTIEYSYDGEKFLTTMSKLTETADPKTGALSESSRQVVQYRTEGPLWVRQTTENYKKSKTTGKLVLVSTVSQISAGHRPGGPGGGALTGYRLADGLAGITKQIEVTATLSTDADALDVDESFEQLDRAALTVILNRLTRANGMREFEGFFTAAAIPWFMRGAVVQFTGAKDETGAAIVFKPMLLHEMKADYTEAQLPPSLTSKLKAVYWE